MADNTTLPGTGDVIASDDIGGVKYQRVKLTHGVDGEAVDASTTNPVPTSDSTLVWLKRIFQALKPLSIRTGAGSNRLSVDVNSVSGNIAQVTLVPTVTTVTNPVGVGNMASVGGATYPAFALHKALNRQGYNGGIRSRLS
jgi:hypothetical protein